MALLLNVNPEESGLKLFAFLRRCLSNEDAEIYRWIRTGQVRINSGRAKSTSKVMQGDCVRVPPFAKSVIAINTKNTSNSLDTSTLSNTPSYATSLKIKEQGDISKQAKIYTSKEKHFPLDPIIFKRNGNIITIPKIYENEHILIINKPEGLASQGGTGQSINLVEILKNVYAHSRFMPAPAHRLDKGTSGILCIGKSYEALRYLSDFMQEEVPNLKNLDKTKVHKEYLAWVHGNNLNESFFNEAFFMEHYVFYDEKIGRMRTIHPQTYQADYAQSSIQNLKECTKQKAIQPIKQNESPNIISTPHLKNANKETAKYALSQAMCLEQRGDYALLKIGLFTGRKHQIRVQCQSLGMPILGDKKYALPCIFPEKNISQKNNNSREIRTQTNLKLHAYRLCLPENTKLYQQNIFEVLPPWQGEFKVDQTNLYLNS